MRKCQNEFKLKMVKSFLDGNGGAEAGVSTRVI